MPHRVEDVGAAGRGTRYGDAGKMLMDGIVLLKEDHKTVEKLFKQFEKAGDTAHAEKRKIADQVVEELTTHTWIEEKIFCPAAREAAPDTRDHVLANVEEHHVVLWILSELKDLDAADERFDSKMTGSREVQTITDLVGRPAQARRGRGRRLSVEQGPR